MASPNDSVENRYAVVVSALAGTPGVTLGAQGKKGFGSSALQVDGRIFAMVSSAGRFVVKLPGLRVEALEAEGVGGRFDPGHGRLMKEWLAIDPASTADWLALAREALQFVRAGK
jgi:hypothetical protein